MTAATHDRDVRDALFDELLDRADEIEGTILEGVTDRPWIHTQGQVKRWLMELRNEFFIADDSTTLDDPAFDAHIGPFR